MYLHPNLPTQSQAFHAIRACESAKLNAHLATLDAHDAWIASLERNDARTLDIFQDEHPEADLVRTTPWCEQWTSDPSDEHAETAWFCRDCGGESEWDDQCSVCGYGAPEACDEPI